MSLTLSVDLSQLLGAGQEVTANIRARAAQVVVAVAEQAAYQWKDKVFKARLWAGEKTPYVASITWESKGPLEAVVKSDYSLAEEIESGRPARDLKLNIGRSQRARANKKGIKYLIIPFRHNTPTASGEGAHAPQMPLSIYKVAKSLAPSRALPAGSKKPATRLSATGFTVPQHSYDWGGRLPAGLAPKKSSSHKTDIYAGMVRFDTSSGKSRSSAYLTFRIMSENSSGWVVPAKPGLYLAKGVTDNLGPLFEQAMREAVARS